MHASTMMEIDIVTHDVVLLTLSRYSTTGVDSSIDQLLALVFPNAMAATTQLFKNRGNLSVRIA
jgi:hypothetical protein